MNSDSDDEYPPFPKFAGHPPGREWCGFEWDLWRSKFEAVVYLRKLEDGDAKCHAKLSMTGPAARKTHHIERGPNDGPDKVDLTAYLDRLEALFSPPAGSHIAKSEFETARGQQETPGRDIVVYHAQLKFLWQRAYPDLAEKWEEEPELRRKFIMGIANASVRKRVQERNPKTYSEALEQGGVDSLPIRIKPAPRVRVDMILTEISQFNRIQESV